MSTTSSPVADLQSQWHTLHDLDRASAVIAIHQAGTSLRVLATALNCSESLLRHLLAALQAPPADRFLARQYNISISELVRRAKAIGIRRSNTHREALELERAQAARQGSRKICGWLADENLQGGYGAQIVDDARRLFARRNRPASSPRTPRHQICQLSRLLNTAGRLN